MRVEGIFFHSPHWTSHGEEVAKFFFFLNPRTVSHKSHDPCFHVYFLWKQESWLLWPTVQMKTLGLENTSIDEPLFNQIHASLIKGIPVLGTGTMPCKSLSNLLAESSFKAWFKIFKQVLLSSAKRLHFGNKLPNYYFFSRKKLF